LLLLHDMHVSF